MQTSSSRRRRSRRSVVVPIPAREESSLGELVDLAVGRLAIVSRSSAPARLVGEVARSKALGGGLEATSPACAPPIPSATAKSGARAKNESSLALPLAAGVGAVAPARRLSASGHTPRSGTRCRRSGSRRRSCSSASPCSSRQLRRVPLVEFMSSTKYAPAAVEHRGRGCRRRSGRRCGTSASAGAADREAAEEVEALALRRGRRRCSATSQDASVAGGSKPPGRLVVAGLEAGRGACARRSLQRAARHPEQEQVEDGEEAELERYRERLVDRCLLLDVEERRSSVPRVTSSPGAEPGRWRPGGR